MASKVQTQLRARAIAESLKSTPLGAIDLGTILDLLMTIIPWLIDCFNPADGQEAQQYVAKRFNAGSVNDEYGGYDKRLVKATARAAMNAGKKRNILLTYDQAYAIALKTLDNIRTGDEQEASIVIRENTNFMLI